MGTVHPKMLNKRVFARFKTGLEITGKLVEINESTFRIQGPKFTTTYKIDALDYIEVR